MCELGRNAAVRNDIERDPHVFSNMNPTRFAVIGQNPGWNELKAGEPFVGDAGANFNKEIEANGLSRDDFYIGNGVKCFTPKNAKPGPKHQERCKPFLKMELSLIKPLLVIVLGASAFEALCPGVKFGESLKKITKSEAFDVNVYAVYHPSPRNMNSPGRANMFRDQIKVLCKLVNKLKQKHNL
jgi:DNA polymerase